MKKGSPLRKTREARGFRGYEIAEKLGLSVVRYMAIEMEWEEANEEEVLKIRAFFRMSPLTLGFASKFWSLSCDVPESILLEKGTVMQLKLW